MENIIKKFSGAIINTIDKAKKPAMTLPSFLIKSSALQRPGMSSMDISSRVIGRFKEIGIPTGDNADGTPNLVNAAVYAIVSEIVHAIKFDHVVNCVIPKGSLQIMSTGGNAGGPITTYGYNITDTLIKGF